MDKLFRLIDGLSPDDMVKVVRYAFSSLVENDERPSESLDDLAQELLDLATSREEFE